MKTDLTLYVPEALLAIVAIVALVTGNGFIAFMAVIAFAMRVLFP